MEHSEQPIMYPILSGADLDMLQYRSQLCNTNQYGRLLSGAPALIPQTCVAVRRRLQCVW